jgi:hypothetical protein
MKRIAVVLAVLGLAGCSKGDDKSATPATAASPAPDTTHGMMGDTSKHMMMNMDSSKGHMMMQDTTKKK